MTFLISFGAMELIKDIAFKFYDDRQCLRSQVGVADRRELYHSVTYLYLLDRTGIAYG